MAGLILIPVGRCLVGSMSKIIINNNISYNIRVSYEKLFYIIWINNSQIISMNIILFLLFF